jgi:hypothetical protein
MRFFKANQPMSEEDEAAAARLTAIATRTRAANARKLSNADSPDLHEPLQLREVLQ